MRLRFRFGRVTRKESCIPSCNPQQSKVQAIAVV